MANLVDAIGQPLRVGQACVWMENYFDQPDDDFSVGAHPGIVWSFDELGVLVKDATHEIVCSFREIVVIGSSVAEVDARVEDG